MARKYLMSLAIVIGFVVSAGAQVPVHTPLPDVTVYDVEGNTFSLAELKGSYSVLVFGCLT